MQSLPLADLLFLALQEPSFLEGAPMEKRNVIVVGAGIGGLATAYWLRERGFDVEIFEATNRPAGRIVTFERAGDRVDVGAQFFHSTAKYSFELIRAAGLDPCKRQIRGNVQFRLRDGSSYVYNRWVPYMKILGLRGNLKLAYFIVRYVLLGKRFPPYSVERDIPEYDNTRMVELWGSPEDQPLRDFILNTLCAAEAGASVDHVTLYDFIRTWRLTMFSGYVGLTGGVASLAEEMAKRLPVRYREPVRQLVQEGNRVVGVQLERDGSVRRATHVVVAVEPPNAVPLLPQEWKEERTFLGSLPDSSAVLPVFFLSRRLPPDLWCYFLDPALERVFSFALDGCNKIPEMVPSGRSVLTLWGGEKMTREFMAQPDEEILRVAREDLEVLIPGIGRDIVGAALVRHAYVMASCSVGHQRRVLDLRREISQRKRMSLVSDVFGIGMEGAVASAAAAVRRILAEESGNTGIS